MSESSPSRPPEKPGQKAQGRRPILSRNGLMLLAIAVSSLPTLLVILAFPVGNFLVRKQWEQLRQQSESKGELLKLEAHVGSPPANEEDNFAKAPIIDEIYRKAAVPHLHDRSDAGHSDDHDHNHDHDHDHSHHPAPTEAPPPSRLASFNIFSDGKVRQPASAPLAFLNGKPVDLATCLPQDSEAFDPLTYLKDAYSPHQPIIEELLEAARRPDSFFPLNLDRPSTTKLFHVPPLISALHSLRLHNLMLIEDPGTRDEEVARQVIDTLRLIRHGTSSSGLASYSIRTMALESAGLEVIWHALYRQRFDDAQWAEIEKELRGFQFGPRLMKTLRFERAAMIREFEASFKPDGNPFSIPPKWIRLSGLIGYVELTQQYWFTDTVGGRILTEAPRLAQLAAIEAEVQNLEMNSADLVIATGVIPVHDFALRAASVEAQHSHARIAIAMERYRLAHGHLPEKLNEVVPDFLDEIPLEPFTDQPPRLERFSHNSGTPPSQAYRLRPIDHDSAGGPEPVWQMPEPVPFSESPQVSR